jgi:hypothetical protein
VTPSAPGTTRTCAPGSTAPPDWLADAGYEVVDAEPPQIAEVAAAWYDAIWADVGTLWPGMEPITGPDEVEFVEACLAQGVFKPVDQDAARDLGRRVPARRGLDAVPAGSPGRACQGSPEFPRPAHGNSPPWRVAESGAGGRGLTGCRVR